jgi:hypothetical protein
VRFEPPVDRSRLLAAVRDAYGIPARQLTFVPVGLGAAFYLLRRYVEDMAVCLRGLLDEDADGREDAALLHGMAAWGVAPWSRLDDTLATVAVALRQDGRWRSSRPGSGHSVSA